MSTQHANNALALIDQVNPGTGGYRDENLMAVAGVKRWLRQIAAGELLVVDPPKVEPPAPKGEVT
jgi:hypothetical protein